MNTYTFDEIQVGMSASFARAVTAQMEDTFRELTGDDNPLHRDDAFARSELGGVDSHVAFGMLTASFYSTLAGMYLPGRHSLIHSLEIKFLKPVFAGDMLTVSGVVTDRQETLKLLRIRAKIINQKDECVSKAAMKVLVLK